MTNKPNKTNRNKWILKQSISPHLVQQASNGLKSKPDEKVLSALSIMKALPDSRNNLESRIESLANKVNRFRDLRAQFPLALHLISQSSALYRLSERTQDTHRVNEISFDLRTNSSEGLLVYLVSNPQDMTPSGSSWLVSGVLVGCNRCS